MHSAGFANWCRRPVGRGLFLSSVCSVALFVAAGNLHAETLTETLAQAYRYNPQLDAQRATLRATDESVSQANAGYRPDIRASADIGHQHQTTTPRFGNSNEQSTSPGGYGVELIQPLFRGFQVTNAVNSAEADVRAGRETLRDVEQQVLLSAVTAYGDVVRDQAILKLRESNLNFLNTELKATKERFTVGEVTRTDVAQAEARRALGQSELDLARANLKSSRASYEEVVGNPPQNLADPTLTSKLLPKSLQDGIGIGTRENPKVVAALYTEQSARFQVDQIRGELLPTAQLEATYTDRFNPSSQIRESETASIVGRLNVPIYANGGEVHSRVRQAKHQHLARIQQIEQQRALVQSQVAQAWSQLSGFRAQRESDKAQIEANRVALNGVREEEKVGQRTLIDVLNAQQELLTSQVQQEITKRNLLIAVYTVISAVGRLSVTEVGASSAVYDPEVHYQEVRRKWWGIDITHDDGRTEHIDTWNTRVEQTPVK
jgi:outer membrane protein